MTERVKFYCMNAVQRDLIDLAERSTKIRTPKDASLYAAKSDALKGIVMDLYGEDA